MDNIETESNCSESLQWNASTISGLSLYGNEFAELRHLVNPAKYPVPYLDSKGPFRAENLGLNDANDKLKSDLQKSLELNEKYKSDLHNLERLVELKFHEQIDKLLRQNSRLEGQLQNANSQVERLIGNYQEKKGCGVYELEKQFFRLNSEVSSLKKQCATLQEENSFLHLENKCLKTELQDVKTDCDLKNSSIQSLKQKIAEQFIEIQKCKTSNNDLLQNNTILKTNLGQCEKSKNWYKEQLHVLQLEKHRINETMLKDKNKIISLNEELSSLHISIGEYKNQVEKVRLQALNEKEELFQKLESINNIQCVEAQTNNVKEECLSPNNTFYELTIEDLKNDILKVKNDIQVNEKECEQLMQENSVLMSKCLIMQKSLQQQENDRELEERAKKKLTQKLEYYKENEKETLCENLQLKNKVTELEVELDVKRQEKQIVEDNIQIVRDQFAIFTDKYEKVKQELTTSNKTIMQLEKDKQELFMHNNWAICEREEAKKKDAIIENLKRELSGLNKKNFELSQCVEKTSAEKEKLKSIVEEKEKAIEKQVKEVEEFSLMVNECKNVTLNYENRIIFLQNELITLNKEKRDLKELEKLKGMENTKLFTEKNELLVALDNLEAKYECDIKAKNIFISDLEQKIKNLENIQKHFGITDDQKFARLYQKEKIKEENFSKLITSMFNNLNIEELESTVNIRLKSLDKKIREVQEKINNNIENSKVDEMRTLLQVKDREMQEKQKKMDRNNRLLLRKVKEHMKGRNFAEKQTNHLQDLYNSLSDAHNTLKLSLAATKTEMQNLATLCETYKSENSKLREAVLNFEKDLSKSCNKQWEYDQISEMLVAYTQLKDEYNKIDNQLKISQNTITELQCQLGMKETSLLSLKKENTDIKSQLNAAQIKDKSQEELIARLQQELAKMDGLFKKSEVDLVNLSLELEEAKDKEKVLSCNFQQKIEYSEMLEDKLVRIESKNKKREEENQNVVLELKNSLGLLQEELKNFKNDKFFLQRLTSDLKTALKSYVEQNKHLNQQLEFFTRAEKQQVTTSSFSLLANDFSLKGNKYDEQQISELLEENQCFSVQKPVALEIQGCLNKLRQEIVCLQDQIAKKSNTYT